MLKKIIFTILLCAVSALTVFPANAPESTQKELQLTNLIIKADSSLDLNESEIAKHYLQQAKDMIVQNPEINLSLQGHFNKVSGKLYMKTSIVQAHEYFNTALMQFAGDPAEQARVNLFVGIAYYYANDFNTAKVYFTEAKEYFTGSEDDLNLAQALNNLGVIAFKQGNDQAAIEFCQQALLINIEFNASLNASRNRFNLDYFADSSYLNIALGGGGGGSGSGTTVDTSGSGTIVVGGNGGFTGN